jgi:crotonobetainyl-CoA:carnitine CoA-transferase CaiB-like acyl-CoA transferase
MAAPLLGQHNNEVLTDLLGYGEDEIEVLRREGVIT